MPRSLVDMIRLYTGYDATTEPAFEFHDHLPCGRCGKVTLTALLIEDDDTPAVRTCVDCCPVWQ